MYFSFSPCLQAKADGSAGETDELFTHNSSVQTELYIGVMGCSKKPQKWGRRYATNGSEFNF
jgi:hypothetical protein